MTYETMPYEGQTPEPCQNQDTSVPEIPLHLRKPKLRRWEASEYLKAVHGIEEAPATLAKKATLGGGPRFHRVGRVPLYPVVELDDYARTRLGPLVGSTSELTEGADGEK